MVHSPGTLLTSPVSSCSARNARTRSRVTRFGCPVSSTRETVSTACADRAISRVARRKVDLDPLKGCSERRPQGLRSPQRATPVVGEPQPQHAQAVTRSFRDCGEIRSIQAQGRTTTPSDWRGQGRLAHDRRDDRRFERCRQREISREAHADHADPRAATLTIGRRCECPQPPDDGARAVSQLGGSRATQTRRIERTISRPVAGAGGVRTATVGTRCTQRR